MANTCVACGQDSQSPSGSVALTNCICNLGYTDANDGTCDACAAGKYKPATGAGTCTDCLAGKYVIDVGADTCTNCDVNTYSAAVGATLPDTCVACVNSQSPSGSVALTNCICNMGYTGPNGGTCDACKAGKFKPATGAGICTDCDLGKYSLTMAETAEAVCLTCPGVSTSSVERTSCQCNAGYTGTVCDACAAGKYKSVPGSEERYNTFCVWATFGLYGWPPLMVPLKSLSLPARSRDLGRCQAEVGTGDAAARSSSCIGRACV